MTLQFDPTERIILALDGMDQDEACLMISRLPGLKWVKVGLELFLSSGPDVILRLRDLDLRIFLDLKFHDIPATVAGACRCAAKSGAELISLHACNGKTALREAKMAAFEGASESGLPSPILLAVTVLTSWDESRFRDELLINQSIDRRVEWLARLSKESGINGCVCSSLEVSLLRTLFPIPFELVTPGIRMPNSNLNDQSRVMTPSGAIKSGASKIVIGRLITNAKDPYNAFKMVCSDLAHNYRDSPI